MRDEEDEWDAQDEGVDSGMMVAAVDMDMKTAVVDTGHMVQVAVA
jgi:hypothetical protein